MHQLINNTLRFSALGFLAFSACEPTPAPTTPTSASPDIVQPTKPLPTATASAIATTQPVAAAGPAKGAVMASNAFGMALYQQLKAQPGNLAFSPTSISLALAMTYAGAKGETAAEMRKTLRFPSDDAKLHGGWATSLSDWQAAKDVEIAVANRIFGDKRYTFEAPFLGLTKARYGAPIVSVDFAGAPEAQRVRINQWVAKQTRERILDLIPPEGVTADTRMALVNAIYFKARWASPFFKAATQEEDFKLEGGATVKAPMMSRTISVRYAEVDGAQLAELPYKGGRFAALFVLPPAGVKMAAFEGKLDAAKLGRWTGAVKMERTWMKLPRFTLKPGAPVELSGPLKVMGMRLPFSSAGADFTGMTNPANPDDRLSIQKIYHKAFVAMDEEGTEAAAATAVMMGRAGAVMAEPKKFHADRAFLFFIRDAKTGLVLFAGRVLEPTN